MRQNFSHSRSFIAWLIATTCISMSPLTTLSQVGTNTNLGESPGDKTFVGDFDRPRGKQTRIIDEKPILHGDRFAPPEPAIQGTKMKEVDRHHERKTAKKQRVKKAKELEARARQVRARESVK
jgi:hypothetical protein